MFLIYCPKNEFKSFDNKIIPIVPKIDKISPTFSILIGLKRVIKNVEKESVYIGLFFFKSRFNTMFVIAIIPALTTEGDAPATNIKITVKEIEKI